MLPLEGFAVAITADRRREEQAELLRRRGARTVDAPCIRTLPLASEDGMRAATDALIDRAPDYLVANTGIGLRGWLAAAATWGLEQPLLDALAETRVLARGPKAAGAMHTAGLRVWWQAPSEQLSEVAELLLSQPLDGSVVAVQLHGDDQQELTVALQAAGAKVVEIPVYRWTLPEDTKPALRLVEDIVAHRVDAVTFTAAPAVHNLFRLAADAGAEEGVRDAFNSGVLAACIGPVCAAAARDEGVLAPLVPDRWRLGALVHALSDHFRGATRHLRIAGVSVALQGDQVVVNGAAARLTIRERALFETLLERPGATVTRPKLLRSVWGSAATPEHNLDVTVARLRTKLGPAGAGLHTSPRRGYRVDADDVVIPPVEAS